MPRSTECTSGRRLRTTTRLVSAPVRVDALRELTAHFTRVELAGEALATYEHTPGDVFRLLIPPAGHERPVMASFGDDGFPYWPDPAARPTLRTYAVRASAGTALTFDAGRLGPGPTWLDRVRPGDHFHVVGMRHGMTVPAGTRGVVLVTDASGLPGAAAIVDGLRPELPVTVLAEAPGTEEQALLPQRVGVDVHWTIGTSSHGTGSPLEELVRRHALSAGGSRFRITAEAGVARAVRAHLLDERGVDLADTVTIGQWQAGATSDERDAELLPHFEHANAAGLDLGDLDVLEALDLGLPLPSRTDPTIPEA